MEAEIGKAFVDNLVDLPPGFVPEVITLQSHPERVDAVCQKLAIQFNHYWSRPPYNEHLVHPDVIGSEFSFDPPSELKLGCTGSNPEEIAVAIEQGWVPFWSFERTREYIINALSSPNGTLVLVNDTRTVDLENNSEIAAWFLGFEVDLSQTLGHEVHVQNEPITSTYYLDTSGIGSEYRTRLNKIQFLHSSSMAIEQISNDYSGTMLTRVHSGANTINRITQDLYGFQEVGTSQVDGERIYLLKTNASNTTLDGSPLPEREGGILMPNLSKTLVHLSGRSIGKINRRVHKTESYLQDSITNMLAEVDEGEHASLLSLQDDIENGYLYDSIRRSLLDIALTGPGAIMLSLLTHTALTATAPAVEAIAIALEASPLAGLSSIYRTLYIMSRYTIPRTIKHLKNNERKEAMAQFGSSFATMFDGGWILTPFVGTLNDPRILSVAVWRQKKEFKRLLSKLKPKR